MYYKNVSRTEIQKENRKILEASKAREYSNYYYSHLEEMHTCRICCDVKPLSEFVSNYSFKSTCKGCHRNRIKGWRRQNPESVVKTYAKSFKRTADHIKSYKLKPCTKCGKSFPSCALDFHHVTRDDKSTNVSRLYQRSIKRIDKEIGICHLICANCHRDETHAMKDIPFSDNRVHQPPLVNVPIETGDNTKICAKCGINKNTKNFTRLKTGYLHSYCKPCLRDYNNTLAQTRNKKRRSKEYVRQVKEDSPCIDCGSYFHYWIMDFDHVRGEKSINLNKLQNCSLARIKTEIAKCDLVCACCHRIRTSNKKEKPVCDIYSNDVTTAPTSTLLPIDLQATSIQRATQDEARQFLDKYHYAGYGRTATVIYKISHIGTTVAIVKFAPVVRQGVATSEGWDSDETLELDRLCIAPEFQVKNLASRSIALAAKQIRQDVPKIRHLISFADLAQNHTGTVYKAANWQYLGTCATSHKYVDANGRTLNKKLVYNNARKLGLTECEYAESEQLTKIRTPGKNKYHYELH